MSVRRRVNWVSQQRVEPHNLRSIESAVSSDFDELLSSFAIGQGKSYVIRGFDANMSGIIGSPANSITVNVSDAAILHGSSTVSGTFYAVPVGTPIEVLNSLTNSKVQGSFTPNSLNYVAFDFVRAADTATSGPVTIRDVVAKTEIVKNLPLAQTLKYKFVISTSGFASGNCPLFVVETDAANNVVSIEDERDLLYRQGKPNSPAYKFPWTDGRLENNSISFSDSTNPFFGGDKQINNLKDWMDAVTSSLQEVKGTPYWYSENSAGSLLKLRADATNTIVTSRGNVAHDAATPGKVNWSHDVHLKVLSSSLDYIIDAYSAGTNVVLSDGEVAYVKLVRDAEVSASLIFTNGSPIVTSVGAVGWTSDVQAGDFIKAATASDFEYYEILTVDSPSAVTLVSNFSGTSTPAGTDAVYSWGTYSAVAIPSTDRHIKIADRSDIAYDDDVFWLFFRDDNGSSVPKIYTRFKAGEIEQGESIEISDGTSEQLLAFVGSTGESDSAPAYAVGTNALVPYPIVVGDNLTFAISQLIQNINDIYTIFDQPSYDESYLVVAAAPGTGEILGPIATGTTINIPVNSRVGGSPQQYYVVGKGALEVYLNGQYLFQNSPGGWYEVGTVGNQSFQIEIDQDLIVGDRITFRLDANGGPGTGGSGGGAVDSINTLTGAITLAAGANISITPAGNTLTIASTGGGGPAGDFDTLTEATVAEHQDTLPIYDESVSDYRKIKRGNFIAKSIVSVSIDYSVSEEDDVILVDATAGDVIITLPDASLTSGYQKTFDVKKIDSSLNTVTVVDAGGNNIDSALSWIITGQNDSVTFLKDKNNDQYWMI